MDIVSSILEGFDIYGDSGFRDKPRTGLLIDHAMFQEGWYGSRISAELFSPAGRGVGSWYGESVVLHGDQMVMQDVPILWSLADTITNRRLKEEIVNGPCYVMHAAQKFMVEGGQFAIDHESYIMPLTRLPRSEIRCLELFSGAWGGWAFAGKVLGGMGRKWSFGAVEIAHDLAKIYAVNHRCPLVPAHVRLDPYLLENLPGGFVLNGDVSYPGWWEAASRWAPDVISISAPCPPWSTASSQSGLGSAKGRLLVRALGVCKLLRPRVVLLEQVLGFASHPQKHLIMKVLHWAGYRVHWQGSLELNDHLPVRRPRWLAIAYRVHDEGICFDNWQRWPAREIFTVDQVEALRQWPPEIEAKLRVPEAALSLAGSYGYGAASRKRLSSGECRMTHEFDGSSTSIPTFMAMYGSQHCLDVSLLRERGFFGHWLKNGLHPRFWHPAEIAILHQAIDAFLIPHDFDVAWLLLGNQIAIRHALFLELNTENALRTDSPPLLVNQVFVALDDQVMTAPQMRFKPLDKGTLWFHHELGDEPFPTPMLKSFDALLGYPGQLPSGLIWLPTYGIRSNEDVETLGDLFILDQPLRELASELRNFLEEEDSNEENDPCPPTVPFGILARVELAFCNGPKFLKIEDSLTLDSVRDLWHGHFHADDATLQIRDGARFEFSNEAWEFNAIAQDVALVLKEGEFYVHHRHGTKDCEAYLRTEDYAGPWFDQFGQVGVGQACDDCVLFSQQVMMHVVMRTPVATLGQACRDALCRFDWDPMTDAVVATFQGPDEAARVIQRFWIEAIEPATARLLGFRIQSGGLEGKPFLQFVMEDYRTLPPQAWLVALAVMGARSYIELLMEDGGVPVTLRWCGRPLWLGPLRRDLRMGQLMDVLRMALSPIGRGQQFRLIRCSKRLPDDCTLDDLTQERRMSNYTIQIIQALHGGGVGKQPPRTQLKNSIATTLLENGHELRWVGRSVDKLMEGHSAQQAAAAVSKPQGAPQYEAILQLLKTCGIAVQTESYKVVPNGNQTKKRITDIPDLAGFVIQKGFFTNEDDTEAKQLTCFCPKSTGVLLTSVEQALPWLRESQVLAKDEFALLCVGSSALSTSLEQVAVTVPCVSPAGEQVILAAIMVQLGEKKIQVLKGKHQSSQGQLSVLAMTLWKQDWNEEEWQKCIHAPASVLKAGISLEDGTSMVQSTWGRSLRHKRKLVLPSQASSVQLHAAVLPEHLERVLTGSGFNKIFCTPKRRDGRPDDSYKVIWVEGDVARLTALSYKVSRCMGLVRGRDGMGIRLHKDNYADAWNVIHPGLPVPHHDGNMNMLYKLEPLPFGTSSAALEEWSKAVSWVVRPIKPLGARAWLVGASSEPPSSFLLYNTAPVMIKFLPPREGLRQPLVVAGKLSKNDQEAPWDIADVNSVDPWARYRLNSGTNSAPSVVSMASTSSRQVTGPTEAKFTEQSARILKLEEQVNCIAQQHKEHRNEVKEQFDGIAQREQTTQEMLKNLRADFTQSITQATSMQTKELHSSLNELKDMFLSTIDTGHKRPRPAPGLGSTDDAEMRAAAPAS